MRRLWLFLFLLSAALPAQTPRPAITGIAFVHFYETDLKAATIFYHDQLGLPETARDPGTLGFAVNRYQSITLSLLPSPAPETRLAGVGFHTSSVHRLQRYLEASGVPAEVHDGVLRVVSPAGTELYFVAGTPVERIEDIETKLYGAKPATQSSMRILHAGWVVHDRAAEEHFFRDILGFRPYWFGGPEGQPVQWVSMQVPEGHDWVELMLRTGADSLSTRGVLNHVSLGVQRIDDAAAIVEKNGLPANLVQPKAGRDGKWQLNLYDPEHTRVEFMEFTPRNPSCCSPFTAPHPSANDGQPPRTP